ncbi:metallophosphoesterase family protein [Haloferax larsenii]|uniref:Serine/threonine protein phosphatase 1 n=1 Tax=Haloferax larsenii TaxID=302484 RepID=A0A1H7UFY8_HALLR|nr:metallophosphoesterase family protein [Haloferax larsenii]SEL95578.1 serine/threonine protein phosphatase 1 [Haloferax larsenii]
MSALSFHPDVAEQHLRVDIDDWDDVYVVGDVHGCLPALERLVDCLDPSEDDLVVFVGDLVRKGPDSKGVVDYVRERDNFLTVRGNNEEKLIRGTKEIDALTDEDLDWMESLPVAISWEDTLVVHGGVHPEVPLEEHDVDKLQNTRAMNPGDSYDGPFWFEHYDGPERVFFGHTVMAHPAVFQHAMGLDTGAVYGGTLTAYDFHADDLVSIDVDVTHESRKDSKILEPRQPALV